MSTARNIPELVGTDMGMYDSHHPESPTVRVTDAFDISESCPLAEGRVTLRYAEITKGPFVQITAAYGTEDPELDLTVGFHHRDLAREGLARDPVLRMWCDAWLGLKPKELAELIFELEPDFNEDRESEPKQSSPPPETEWPDGTPKVVSSRRPFQAHRLPFSFEDYMTHAEVEIVKQGEGPDYTERISTSGQVLGILSLKYELEPEKLIAWFRQPNSYLSGIPFERMTEPHGLDHVLEAASAEVLEDMDTDHPRYDSLMEEHGILRDKRLTRESD